jgi:hypothetical protein
MINGFCHITLYLKKRLKIEYFDKKFILIF